MMNRVVFVFVNGCLIYGAEILGLVTGVGAIAARDYGRGVQDVLQSSAIVFGSISVIALRRGIHRVHHSVATILEVEE
jgi:fumarate reductase subunit D